MQRALRSLAITNPASVTRDTVDDIAWLDSCCSRRATESIRMRGWAYYRQVYTRCWTACKLDVGWLWSSVRRRAVLCIFVCYVSRFKLTRQDCDKIMSYWAMTAGHEFNFNALLFKTFAVQSGEVYSFFSYVNRLPSLRQRAAIQFTSFSNKVFSLDHY